jgi:uncharacterized protein (TIGR03086 family)
MPATPVDQLSEVLATTQQLVGEIHDAQWTSPTPCTDWNVRDLVNHLVNGNLGFADLPHGRPPSGEDIHRGAGVDRLGEAPVLTYRYAANALLAAFRRPGALDQPITVAIGTVPGVVAVHLRIIETLVHAWDLALATGRSVGFPDDVVEQELAISQERLTGAPAGRWLFAPPRSAPVDAPALDRLAARLGRPVDG